VVSMPPELGLGFGVWTRERGPVAGRHLQTSLMMRQCTYHSTEVPSHHMCVPGSMYILYMMTQAALENAWGFSVRINICWRSLTLQSSSNLIAAYSTVQYSIVALSTTLTNKTALFSWLLLEQENGAHQTSSNGRLERVQTMSLHPPGS
jgi:hypothetical protein